MNSKSPNIDNAALSKPHLRPGSAGDLAKDSSFYVEDWFVDVGANRIRRGDQEQKLEAKVMDVLVYFAGRPGELVTRESLEKEIWAGRVVSYESLTSSINKLRKAFGDNPRDPHVIETVSKKGYRFIGQLNKADIGNAQIENTSIKPKSGPIHKSHKILAFGVFLLLLFAGAISQWTAIEPEEQVSSESTENSGLVAESIATQSLTVLPFVDISSDISKRYLGDGITEDLTTALSKISGFFVIARSSALTLKMWR